MPVRDTLLALLVAFVWGLTFIAIRLGVSECPPLALSALRFAFAAFPAVLFVRPPKAAFGLVTLYGLLIGVGQFGVLFIAFREGMPVGLASLVMQAQAFVTVALAYLLFGERMSRNALIGAGVAVAGMVVIGAARYHGAAFLPFALTVLASLFWGLGNIVGKKVGRVDMFAFTVWSSLAPVLPLFALSALFEGGGALKAVSSPSLTLVLCVAALSFVGTLFGYGLWTRLLSRHSAGQVAPFALLVPVVGMAAGALVFGERVSAIEALGGFLVMAGLAINVFGGRRFGTAPAFQEG